jgi:hypothetical protein
MGKPFGKTFQRVNEIDAAVRKASSLVRLAESAIMNEQGMEGAASDALEIAVEIFDTIPAMTQSLLEKPLEALRTGGKGKRQVA